MTREELKTRIEKIIERGGDPETAHSMEDDLHIDIIKSFAPEWVTEEVQRLSDVDFPRWCA